MQKRNQEEDENWSKNEKPKVFWSFSPRLINFGNENDSTT
jgi:hypothetical protein